MIKTGRTKKNIPKKKRIPNNIAATGLLIVDPFESKKIYKNFNFRKENEFFDIVFLLILNLPNV